MCLKTIVTKFKMIKVGPFENSVSAYTCKVASLTCFISGRDSHVEISVNAKDT